MEEEFAPSKMLPLLTTTNLLELLKLNRLIIPNVGNIYMSRIPIYIGTLDILQFNHPQWKSVLDLQLDLYLASEFCVS